jgi:hypothetical protein
VGKGKGSGSGRPPKIDRISGTYDLTKKEGKNAVAQLQYCKIDGDKAWINTEEIERLIKEYIEENTYTETSESGQAFILYKAVSPAGLRIKLNISKSSYDLYLHGYVSEQDRLDDRVGCNQSLMDVMRAGDDLIIRYMSEQGGKYDMQRCIRFLESKGEISPTTIRNEVSGKLLTGKWAKRAE